MTETTILGRRERKKHQTREALRDSARRLFAERGFAATTIQQITDDADVSERTFFRYFDSKEDLLLPDLVDLFESVERAIRSRPADEPPLTSILEAILGVLGDPGIAGATLAAPDLGPASPLVAGRLAKAFVDWEDRLAAVLMDRFTAASAAAAEAELALQASVVSRAAVSAVRATFRTLRGRPTGQVAVPQSMALTLRAAFAVLASGCPAPR